MSGREWKPGDVAMVTFDRDRIAAAIYSTSAGAGCPAWETGTGYVMAHRIEDIRPLVVIDPEDREQVERLVRAFVDALPDRGPCTVGRQRDAMTAALREYATPDEPTGLGAVVEDADGDRWVRKGNSSHGEDWTRQIGDAWTGGSWDRIAAVRVLSEGVTQ